MCAYQKTVHFRPKINQEVSVDVAATEEFESLTYQVLGRGDVIVSKTIPVSPTQNYNFKFLASFAMVPKASLIVYYIRSDGEIISDTLKMEFADELQNFVSFLFAKLKRDNLLTHTCLQIDLELSADQAKPGEILNISVSTKPNSYVGLLGVDQSVLLLKKGNDIEKSTVFEELDKYNEKTRYNRRWYGGNHGSYSDFDSSGAAIITNAMEEIRK